MNDTKSLDNLLDKLDSQLNAEKTNKKAKRNLPLGIAGAVSGISATTNNPFGSPTLRSVNPPRPPKTDPLNFKRTPKSRTQQARALKKQAMLRRHVNTNPNPPPPHQDIDLTDQDEDQDDDLKTSEDYANENKFKTMDWTEPDGSKTTLKFNEDGTLIGKEKRSR